MTISSSITSAQHLLTRWIHARRFPWRVAAASPARIASRVATDDPYEAGLTGPGVRVRWTHASSRCPIGPRRR